MIRKLSISAAVTVACIVLIAGVVVALAKSAHQPTRAEQKAYVNGQSVPSTTPPAIPLNPLGK